MLRLTTLMLIALPSLAAAEDATPFTYEMFEAGVTHVDIEVCPTALAGPNRFCRVTVANDKINVFVFSDQGDQPLLAFQSFDAALLNGLMD
jgi:hypothetical protein